MDPFVSQCPLCQTSFRVTAELLGAAAGLVRCGACTHVFNAEKHRLGGPAPSSRAAEINQAYINELLGETPATAQHSLSETSPEAPPLRWLTDVVDSDSAGQDATPDVNLIAAASSEDELALATPDPATPVVELPEYKTAVASIMPMPVEMERRGTRKISRAQIGWALACVCAVALLLVQFAWRERDTLAHDLHWRPWYEHACSVFNCSLPPQRDLGKIRSDDLVIRPAPDRPGILLLDAVISNHATFAQPFPKLELVFSQIDGKLVASRVFAAHEYLGPPADKRDAMAARESVQLHLELVDPGEAAVNYRLYLH